MRLASDRLIALCLSLALLLLPIGNTLAAMQSVSTGDISSAMEMHDPSASPCADCAGHGSKSKAHTCCEGTSCALIGGCAACAAAFQHVSLPAPVISVLRTFPESFSPAVSHDPEVSPRPPRA